MKTIVTGPNGFIGHHIMRALPDAIPVPHLRGDRSEVSEAVRGADVIIHTAAISDIGACERDPEVSYHANVLLPVWIAEEAPNAKLIFFSSDQVYSAMPDDGPYAEERTAPGNTYAKHKLEMENRVLDVAPSAILLRATWMFDKHRGFVANLLNQPEITAYGQHRAVTWACEVADCVRQIAMQDIPGGVYNFGSENPLPMTELTQEALRLMGLEKPVTFGGSRHPLWMDCGKLRAQGISFSSSLDGIRNCLLTEP